MNSPMYSSITSPYFPFLSALIPRQLGDLFIFYPPISLTSYSSTPIKILKYSIWQQFKTKNDIFYIDYLLK